MRERRKRLVKSVYKKEGRLNEFERGYEKMTMHKLKILNNFSARKLEELLEKSTKNVAQEVVSILIKHPPILSTLEDLATASNTQLDGDVEDNHSSQPSEATKPRVNNFFQRTNVSRPISKRSERPISGYGTMTRIRRGSDKKLTHSSRKQMQDQNLQSRTKETLPPATDYDCRIEKSANTTFTDKPNGSFNKRIS